LHPGLFVGLILPGQAAIVLDWGERQSGSGLLSGRKALRNIEIGLDYRENEVVLVDQLQVGSEEAFSTLVQIYRESIFNIAYRILGDSTEASDAVQEIFIKIYRGIGRFRCQSSLKTWIYKIAMAECLNRNRWWKRWRNFVPASIDEPVTFNQKPGAKPIEFPAALPTPEDECAARETETHVQNALNCLPFDFRIVVVLRDIEGMTYEEIAESLKLSLGTVKSRLWRARLELKVHLRELLDKPR
jgi:RNA polymerase sigma-70 factor (ECF subfamily)